MLTLYEKRIQMTGVLNLAVVVQAATDQISNDSSQANRKDGGKILIRCTLYIHATIKMVSELHN